MGYAYACIIVMRQWDIETLWYWDIEKTCFMVKINYSYAYMVILQMRLWDTKTLLFLDQKSCCYVAMPCQSCDYYIPVQFDLRMVSPLKAVYRSVRELTCRWNRFNLGYLKHNCTIRAQYEIRFYADNNVVKLTVFFFTIVCFFLTDLTW